MALRLEGEAVPKLGAAVTELCARCSDADGCKRASEAVGASRFALGARWRRPAGTRSRRPEGRSGAR